MSAINLLFADRVCQARTLAERERLPSADIRQRRTVLSQQSSILCMDLSISLKHDLTLCRARTFAERGRLPSADVCRAQTLLSQQSSIFGVGMSIYLEHDLTLCRARARTRTQVRGVMRSLRSEVKDVINHVAAARKAFIDYLQRPDAKQKLVHAFQIEYNGIDNELRALDETKGHMHALADDLRCVYVRACVRAFWSCAVCAAVVS